MRTLIYFYYVFGKLVLILLYRGLPVKGRFARLLKLDVENKIIFAPTVKKVHKIKPELRGKYKVVRLFTKDCVRLYSWFIEPNGDKPVVIFCHGQSENISKWQDCAIFLRELGYGALFLSYRGHYKSAGTPSEKGLYEDARCAISYLNEKGYSCENIVIWGRSLGTSIPCQMALEFGLKGIILESSILDIKSAAISLSKMYLGALNFKGVKAFVSEMFKDINFLQTFDNCKKIKDVKCPILILHSKLDVKIDYSVAEKMHSLNKTSELYLCDWGSHNTNDWCFDRIKQFLSNINIPKNSN